MRLKALCLTGGLVFSLPAIAADTLDSCAAEKNDTRRLACYDGIAGRTPRNIDALTMEQSGAPAHLRVSARESRGSTLSERWELAADDKRGLFLFRPYKPVYLLPLRWSDNPNEQPRGYTARSTASEVTPVKRIEAKFQLSFKTKLLENLFGDNGDLWFGYTQQSNWQLYSKGESSPFRETVFEPEFMGVLRTDIDVLGMKWRFLNIGINHQSNGRSDPYSRSWNRIYAQFGLEGEDFALLIKPWYRIPEKASSDDNRDILDYMGRGEVLGIWKRDGHVLSLTLRHSLRLGDANRGSAAIDWAFPLQGFLKGHLQLFSGYGENLIDYNHRQTIFGLGISLAQWL